jgi:hypothetical protein
MRRYKRGVKRDKAERKDEEGTKKLSRVDKKSRRVMKRTEMKKWTEEIKRN